MKFFLQRWFHTTDLSTGNFTCGCLSNVQDDFHCFVLEDTYRKTKIPKETRVPAETYELKINAADTPLTIKHRVSYNKPGEIVWFKYHIEVCDIPNYKGVYIHAGNDDSHTEGCLLLNYAFDVSVADNQGSKSTVAVKKFYSIVYPLLESGIRCFIEIKDEQLNK